MKSGDGFGLGAETWHPPCSVNQSFNLVELWTVKKYLISAVILWSSVLYILWNFPLSHGRTARNFLLISIDTTRADHLGCYGYPRAVTPSLDRFSGSTTLFANAISQAPDTAASHTSMLTSLYPYIHRVRNAGTPMGDEITSIAEVLQQRGYSTAAFTSGFTLSRRVCGLHQGFDTYIEYKQRFNSSQWIQGNNRPADETNRWVFAWLEEVTPPFFLWVHYFDPHTEYESPPPYNRMFDYDHNNPALTEIVKHRFGEDCLGDVIAAYDGEIRFMDTAIGALFDQLSEHELLPDTLVMVVGDHGEGLGEHRVIADHGKTLYEMELMVPFLVRVPWRRKSVPVQSAFVETIDIMPTALSQLKVRMKRFLPFLQGEDLSPLLVRPGRSRKRGAAYSQNCFYKVGQAPRQISVYNPEWHIQISTSTDHWRTFARETDARELHSLPQRNLDKPALLKAIDPSLHPLLQFPKKEPEEIHRVLGEAFGQTLTVHDNDISSPDLSEEDIDMLRGLGYL